VATPTRRSSCRTPPTTCRARTCPGCPSPPWRRAPTVGGAGIPNIDSVKSTIRAYYGATSAGIANKSTSPYISELAGIEADNTSRLVNQCKRLVRKGGRPAIVFDADDTTLWTYDMEDGAMRFNFDPTLQNTWVTNGLFLATPGMPALVNAVGAAGCTVFGLTGRNDGQKAATLANLAAVGYTAFTPENYYTKWISGSTPPAYVDPNLDGNPATYSTIDYKASTRAHIESQGYDIVANFGDQYSDLIGGSADRSVKLPNPTYYLP
jgi:predicted secreted acid phosphatase